MSLFIWLMKIPGLAWLFFRVLLPIWNFVWSNLEALCHLSKRRTSIDIVNALRLDTTSAALLGKWYTDKGFTWQQDPLSGFLDFSSKPWVSVARNRGDCDDMMVLSEYALEDEYEECHRCYVYSSDGGSHAICLLMQDSSWFVMSNQHLMGPFTTRDSAIRRYYHDKTAWFYVI